MPDTATGYTQSLDSLVSEFSKLPGVGRKTAERLAYHIMKSTRDEAMALADAVRRVKEETKLCSVCCCFTDREICAICDDPGRDTSTICVVEQPKDAMAIERSGSYHGLYHILMGRISPLEGVDAASLTAGRLASRVRAGGIKEVILATNPDMEGDGTALYLSQMLEGTGVSVSRIARGMPTGSAIEYVSAPILNDALRGRRKM